VNRPVTKCVCLDLEFSALKDLARTMNFDFDALSAWSGCCTGCRTCEPYVRLMLQTGETRFPVLSAQEAADIIAAAKSNEKGPPPQAAP
jgi:hypothetical protein